MDEAELELINETQRDQNDESNSTKIAANLNLTTQQQQLKQWANEESAAADMTITGTSRQRGHVSSLSVHITVCLTGLMSNGPSLSFTFTFDRYSGVGNSTLSSPITTTVAPETYLAHSRQYRHTRQHSQLMAAGIDVVVQAIRMRLPELRHVVIMKISMMPTYKGCSAAAVTSLGLDISATADGLAAATAIAHETLSESVISGRSSVKALLNPRLAAQAHGQASTHGGGTVATLPTAAITAGGVTGHSALKPSSHRGAVDKGDSKHQSEDSKFSLTASLLFECRCSSVGSSCNRFADHGQTYDTFAQRSAFMNPSR